MYGSNLRRSIGFAAWILLCLSIVSSGQSEYSMFFGSKVITYPAFEGKALSTFYISPQFGYVDGNIKGSFDPQDPIYLNIDPNDGLVSENDLRLSQYYTHYPGTQVKITDEDFGNPITTFGSNGAPSAIVRYVDVNGDKVYSIEDPVYLDVYPWGVNPGDLRLSNYLNYMGGSRVSEEQLDAGAVTDTLPGMLAFYNQNGNVDKEGTAVYDSGDIILIDTQQPFHIATVNDLFLAFYTT